jgi:hypothetical protein
VSPFRELYRLKDVGVPAALEALVGDLYRAAIGKDFAGYIEAREARNARLRGLYLPGESKRYPGELTQRLRGISFEGDAGTVPIITRPETWTVRPREKRADEREKQASISLSRTRFNNSAHVDLTGKNRCLTVLESTKDVDGLPVGGFTHAA